MFIYLYIFLIMQIDQDEKDYFLIYIMWFCDIVDPVRVSKLIRQVTHLYCFITLIRLYILINMSILLSADKFSYLFNRYYI